MCLNNKSHFGLFAWNLVTNSNTWSPELQFLYGTPGTPTVEEWMQLVFPTDRRIVTEALRHAFRTGIYRTTFRIRRFADGIPRQIYACGNVVFSRDGTPVSLIGVNTDMTDLFH